MTTETLERLMAETGTEPHETVDLDTVFGSVGIRMRDESAFTPPADGRWDLQSLADALDRAGWYTPTECLLGLEAFTNVMTRQPGKGKVAADQFVELAGPAASQCGVCALAGYCDPDALREHAVQMGRLKSRRAKNLPTPVWAEVLLDPAASGARPSWFNGPQYRWAEDTDLDLGKDCETPLNAIFADDGTTGDAAARGVLSLIPGAVDPNEDVTGAYPTFPPRWFTPEEELSTPPEWADLGPLAARALEERSWRLAATDDGHTIVYGSRVLERVRLGGSGHFGTAPGYFGAMPGTGRPFNYDLSEASSLEEAAERFLHPMAHRKDDTPTPGSHPRSSHRTDAKPVAQPRHEDSINRGTEFQ
jgi:hypothetical protein